MAIWNSDLATALSLHDDHALYVLVRGLSTRPFLHAHLRTRSRVIKKVVKRTFCRVYTRRRRSIWFARVRMDPHPLFVRAQGRA